MLHTDFSGAGTALDPVLGYVVLDTDSDYSNGYSQRVQIAVALAEVGSVQGMAYAFEKVASGSYYLYAIIDTDGDGAYTMSHSSPYADAYAYYGNNTTADYTVFVPSAPNVAVGSEGYLTCDFWVGIPYNQG